MRVRAQNCVGMRTVLRLDLFLKILRLNIRGPAERSHFIRCVAEQNRRVVETAFLIENVEVVWNNIPVGPRPESHAAHPSCQPFLDFFRA